MVCWSSQYPIVWYGSIYLFGRWLLESYPSTAAYCWTSMWLHLTAPDFEGRLQWADFAADGPQQSIVVCSFNPFQKLAYEAALWFINPATGEKHGWNMLKPSPAYYPCSNCWIAMHHASVLMEYCHLSSASGFLPKRWFPLLWLRVITGSAWAPILGHICFITLRQFFGASTWTSAKLILISAQHWNSLWLRTLWTQIDGQLAFFDMTLLVGKQILVSPSYII